MIATLAAAAAAVFAGYVGYRAHLRDLETDRLRYTRGVHSWLAWDTTVEHGGTRLVIMNSGEAPIYDVMITVALDSREETAPHAGQTWLMLPPGHFVTQKDGHGWTFPEPADPQQFRPYTRSAKFAVVAMEFTDAVGTRWRRGKSGTLESRRADNPPRR